MTDAVLALSTVPSDFDVRRLARELVELRVAACVSVLPALHSVYEWEGKIEESDEQQVLFKTTRARVDALWTALKARHPYDVPEFLVLPVLDGNPDYLRWVAAAASPQT
jgi:periplasmic divalent cation tolerance protein